jgi:hypothetical protein
MELPEDIFKELVAGGRLDRAGTNELPAGAEQRQTPRVRIAIEVLLLRLNHGRDAKPVAATVVDLSMRGVGIETADPIHVGDAFAIRLKRRDGSALWAHYVAVRWSVLGKGRCAVGAKFTRMFVPAKSADAPPAAAVAPPAAA